MVLAPAFQGFALGLSMILPIGAQNALVLNQGIKRNFHITTATICMVCDATLISLGVFGGGHLISQSELMLTLITLAGALFLFSYGGLSFRSAWRASTEDAVEKPNLLSMRAVVATTLAVTLLNPHVYLDTVVILGGVGGQFEGEHKMAFAAGCALASVVWFYCLSLGAAKLSVWLGQPKVKRVIDTFVGLLMWAIAAGLIANWLGR